MLAMVITFRDAKLLHLSSVTPAGGHRTRRGAFLNYSIHSSRQTRMWLAQFGGNFRLHFLPPYDPDDNRIERKVFAF